MIVPDHSEIELYRVQQMETEVVLQSCFLKKIRGSNFKDHALFFVDSNRDRWLWKELPLLSLISEYIVSILASRLGINIPRSIIAKKGHSIGILQEWMESVEDLVSFSDNQTNSIKKDEIINLFIFEAWIGALDRHGGNYVTSSEGKLWGIDFEKSFSNDTQGSELCLYYPQILSDSKENLKISIEKLVIQINEKQVLESHQFLKLINIPKDPRAKEALQRHLSQIFDLLKDNLTQLEGTVNNYLEKSFSTPDFPLNA